MKFNEIPYTRPVLAELENSFRGLIARFVAAETAEDQLEAMRAITSLRNETDMMAILVFLRHHLDTRDAFHIEENNWMDEMKPHYDGLLSEFFQALNDSKFKEEISVVYGKHLFSLIETKRKTFNPEILEDLQAENKLVSEYMERLSRVRIPFEGEERNLSQMSPYTQSRDRDVRIRAQKAVTSFFLENEAAFDRIFDEMVKTRTLIAKKLGFSSFTALGYARMNRTDYDAAMVAAYRDQVMRTVVPLSQKLRARQAKRLGLESLKYYDEPLEFPTGNATPKGAPDWMIGHAKDMYNEMSPETSEFFNLMQAGGFMDLVAKPGKFPGACCVFIPNLKAPFIFASFNGTPFDMNILTHEAGHAFQFYQSRNAEIPEYIEPTTEASEIHSMSMELLAWPWLERFFQEDTAKYKFSRLSSAILNMPHAVMADEFQHWVYEHPEATPSARRAQWRALERKYLPHRDYEGNEFLERGGNLLPQMHVFVSPFYFIDYALAQVSAFEFWGKAEMDRQSAWKDYMRLCQAGGRFPYLELLRLAGLHNPFEEGSIARIMAPVASWLDAADDSGM
jgi:M3 family oligoendopeptidase